MTTPAVTRIEILEDGYAVTIDGREVRVPPAALHDRRRFRVAMLEAIYQLIDLPTPEEVHRLLYEATRPAAAKLRVVR